MKYCIMAATPIPRITKQPLKTLEIPLNKFSEEVIPHHQKLLEQHKNQISKLISLNSLDQLSKEIIEKRRTIRQLRDLLYELDTLRTQVEDDDLHAFDNKTMTIRGSIVKLTRGYQELQKAAEKLLNNQDSSPESPSISSERINPFEGVAQIQLQEDLDIIKLKKEQERLDRVEEIQKFTQDLNEMYKGLHDIVKEQEHQVVQVEENTSATEMHVNAGFRDIIKSHKLSSVVTPAAGAVVGSLLGGPVGLIAGFKLGGVAALGFAVAGFAGGKIIGDRIDNFDVENVITENDSDHVVNNENNENHSTAVEEREGNIKKIN